MPQATLSRFSSYNRRILLGSVTLLTIAISGVAILSGVDAFTHFRDRQIALFSARCGEIRSEADRLSAVLLQFADLHTGGWRAYETQLMPVDQYREALAAGKGVVISGDDLTATPFSLVTTLTAPKDKARLASMLQLVHDMSIMSVIDVRKPGITLSATVLTPDGTFAAIVPPLSAAEIDDVRRMDPKSFISRRIASIGELPLKKVAGQSWDHGLLWASVPNQPGVTATAARIVLPIFHGDEQVATIVASVPDSEFRQYFMQGEAEPHFFLFDQKAERIIADAPTSTDWPLIKALASRRERLALITTGMQEAYSNGVFTIAQRIPGPNWIAVRAFGWPDVLEDLQGWYLTGMVLCIAAVCFMWAAVLWYIRFIAAPLERNTLKVIEAEQFSQSIVDTLPVGIAVFALPGGALLLQNAGAAHMLNTGRTGASQQFYDHIMRERRTAQVNSMHGPGDALVEVEWTLPDGRPHYLGVASSQTRFRGQDVVLLGLIDISARKASEVLLAEAKLTADRDNQAKSMFLALMSHEIRTPLHGAMGNLELLANSLLEDDQRVRVATIRRTFDSLRVLVDNILDVTRIEAGALKISREPILLNDIVEYCAQIFAPTILSRDVEFYCLTDPSLDRFVDGDEQRLTQVLQNLVSNAAKFTQKGAIVLSVKALRDDEDQVLVRFEVADTGIGVPAASQSTIFRPLTQADDTISRRFGGSGLGLSLCRSLVEMMGGRMTLESEPGKGSVFGVEIPFPVQDASGTTCRQLPLEAMTIAVVCDRPAWRDALIARMQAWGATAFIETQADTRPSVRLIASVRGDPAVVATCSTWPLAGTVRTTPDGPLTPVRNGDRIDVTSLSNRALLTALVTLTDPTKVSEPNAPMQREDVAPLDLLVSEDDPVSRTLVEHQLRALGYEQIRIASDGREALGQWIEQEPDLVIADIGTPYLDGVELLSVIREHNPAAIVVAMTASSTLDANAQAAGFSHVLYKPVSLNDLQRVLADVQRSIPARPQGVAFSAGSETQRDPAEQWHPELHQAFLKSWTDERPRLEQALDGRDVQKLVRRLHRLQGALSIIGREELATECTMLQRVCMEDDWSTVNVRCQLLIAKLDQLARKLG